ncbi:MAG: hypothetical protein Roseis2KO_38500 [Roseivirga sp.]
MVVTVELLWIRAVVSRPIKSPIKGLDVANSIDWAVSPPSIVSEPATISIENRNRVMASTNHSTDPDHFFGPVEITLLLAMFIIETNPEGL